MTDREITQTAKTYLRKAKVLQIEIRQIEREIAQNFTEATSITPSLSESVSSTKDPHKLERFIMREETLQLKLSDRYKKIDKMREEIELLTGDDTEILRTILIDHYFNGRTFEQIADLIPMSLRNVHRYHGRALLEFGKLALNGTIKLW